MKISIKRVCLLLGASALAAAPVAVAVSASASTTPKVPNVSGTFTDKPYTATSPDSGGCGQNWAIDLYTRSFVVSPTTASGTKVVEHFDNAKFITLGDGDTSSAQSPGACDSAGNSGHMLKAGVSGTFSGTFTIEVAPSFTYHSGSGCGSSEGASGNAVDDGCNDATWVAMNFGGAVLNSSDAPTTAYSLTYHATGAALMGNTWTDSSSGNSGDIYTS
jgi:hypothetical protein